MSVDTYYFFLIVLSGFMLLWSFRHFGGFRKSLTDFEYLGFSSFLGIWILAWYAWYTQEHPEKLKLLVSNPLIAGAILSSLGLLVGWVAGSVVGFIRRKIGL